MEVFKYFIQFKYVKYCDMHWHLSNIEVGFIVREKGPLLVKGVLGSAAATAVHGQ